MCFLQWHVSGIAPSVIANVVKQSGLAAVIRWLGQTRDKLVNAGRSKDFRALKKHIQLLEARFGNEIKNIFGIHTPALTANEASYLVGFRTADEIRNRCAKAEKETAKRLLSKGYTRSVGK